MSAARRSGADAGSSQVSYDYLVDVSVERPGLLAAADWPNGSETYSYASGQFIQSGVSGNIVRHTAGSGGVTAVENFGDNLTVTYSSTPGSCQTGSDCCGKLPKVRTVTDLAAGRGDGLDGGSTLSQQFAVLSNFGQTLENRPYRIVDSCSVSGACSAGSTQNEWSCSVDGGLGVELANKDKRDNWETYTWTAPVIDGGTRLERRSTRMGATDMTGSNALTEKRFTYVYGNDGTQLVATEEQDSAFPDAGADPNGRTSYSYDLSNNRLKSTLRQGWTVSFNPANGIWSPAKKYIGTFHFTSPVCAGGSADALGRTVETHGPCFVSSASATDCSGTYPVTKTEYWPSAAAASLKLRLKSVSRYPNGCGTTPVLTTSYLAYDDDGNATSVEDPNGVVTSLVYQGRKLVSSTTAGAQTTYVYDGDDVSAIGYPSGEYDVFCYRDGAGSGCTGARQPVVQWKAKAADAAGVTWSEKVTFAYWPDGTVKSETYSNPSEVRRVVKFAADAHRRPTWRGWGEGSGAFSEVQAYDRADNLVGVGPAQNGAPAWCGGVTSSADGGYDAPVSKLCAAMGYDRADRLESLITFEQGQRVGTTCFQHDKVGNVSTVTQGCASSDSCASGNIQSTCSLSVASYKHDDFGNVVEVAPPNTSTNSVGGQFRKEYDAWGNPSRTQTPLQVLNKGPYTEHLYDMLGRKLSTTRRKVGAGLPDELMSSFAYDEQPASPSSCGEASSSNARGRLRKVTDSFGQTWRQYDALGRLLRETRIRGTGSTTCTGASPNDEPHTEYTYTADGELASLLYPHGRRVTYVYGAGGGNKRRVQSVDVALWNGSSWSSQTLLSDVTWEPYGGMATYVANAPSADGGTPLAVEYLQGGDGEQLPSGADCATSRSSLLGSSDKTGRLRGLWVSTGAVGSGTGDIYKRNYAWDGQLVRTQDTCLLPGQTTTEPQRVSYDYDEQAQLVKADRTLSNYNNTGGSFRLREYAYDARGNRSSMKDEVCATTPHVLNYVVGIRPDQLRSQYGCSGGMAYRAYTFEFNGNASRTSWRTDSSTSPAQQVVFDYETGGFRGGQDTTYRTATLTNGTTAVTYEYFYDAFGQRRFKQYPVSGISDEFFYDERHQLLEDRGSHSLVGGAPYPLDEYVWLDGRPVVVIRSQLDASWARAADLTSTGCQRNGGSPSESTTCQAYFPITDHLKKTVLLLDSAGTVAGDFDVDPFGNINRKVFYGGSVNYQDNKSLTYTMPLKTFPSALQMQQRAEIAFVDTEEAGGTLCDKAWFENSSGTHLSGDYGGYHQGHFYSNWMSTPSDGNIKLRFTSDGKNNAPGVAPNCSGGQVGARQSYSGVIVDSWEYRRFQVAAFSIPLRFPGQYYDSETELAENWSRYYDANVGRYLQPEPLLQEPGAVQSKARSGFSMPAYAYALNNPLRFSDSDGRDVITFDDGFHAGAAFTTQCTNTCEQDPEVVRLDYRCTENWGKCAFWKAGGSLTITKGKLSEVKLDPKETVTRCEADCETTQRALQAMQSACAGQYNVVTNSCRTTVNTALKAAGCGTLPWPSSLP